MRRRLGALDHQAAFATKEGRFWNSDLQITDFDRIREVAYRPWADGTIPRRFCSGRALISDGQWRTVRYSIVEDGGMIGANWGVQWCVVGVDRNWAYNPGLRRGWPQRASRHAPLKLLRMRYPAAFRKL